MKLIRIAGLEQLYPKCQHMGAMHVHVDGSNERLVVAKLADPAADSGKQLWARNIFVLGRPQ